MVVPSAEVDGHERGAGLDQPAGQHTALAPVVPAVAVAQVRIFQADVERPPRHGAADELERLLAEAVHRRLHVGRFDGSPHVVEASRQTAAILQLVDAQARDEVEVLDAEIRSIRIAAGLAVRDEPAAMLTHRHPDQDGHLRKEILSYGVGLSAMITKQALGGQTIAIARRIAPALRHLRDPQSRKNVRKDHAYPRRYDWIERAGMAVGPMAYLRSRRHERRLAAGARR